MWTYEAPVADMLHLMTQVLDAPASWAALPAFDGLDADTAREVLEQAGRFASEVLRADQRAGRPGRLHLDAEGVTTPAGLSRRPTAPSSTAAGRRWPARPRPAARACRSC